MRDKILNKNKQLLDLKSFWRGLLFVEFLLIKIMACLRGRHGTGKEDFVDIVKDVELNGQKADGVLDYQEQISFQRTEIPISKAI